jgi:tRNA A37 threonylcarbamoyladenosine dehydratase
MSDPMSTTKMLAVAGVSASAGALACWLLTRQQSSGNRDRRQLSSAPSSTGQTDELYEEQVSRNTAFFGQEGQNTVRDSFVVVVGLGGVGSHCAHMLARAGVRRIRLIDFDQVTLSSLNRHAVATREDVGISKAAALKKRLLAIVPWCEIDDRNVMFEEGCADSLLAGEPDYVADCIDDVNTKVGLLAICQKKGLKVISCMGAGAKSDPSRLQIGDLNDATRDPLCAKVRYMLKKRQGRQNGKKNQTADSTGMMVVYSSEKPTKSLLPLSEEQVRAGSIIRRKYCGPPGES